MGLVKYVLAMYLKALRYTSPLMKPSNLELLCAALL